MKYALLIYSRDADWDNLSEDARTAIYGEYAAEYARALGYSAASSSARRTPRPPCAWPTAAP